ncbi:hypothetical protein ACQCN2_08420 [Brevibacillus ginsengisoli]|uniref:hypothetical protein n=1 Tax=Brevibacillus ginsengisoli TaxID=363854 RepID=UPI003CF90806
MGRHYYLLTSLIIAAFFLLSGCNQTTTPSSTQTANPAVADKFDPEKQQEYGMLGIYLGEGVKEAIDQLKPTHYEFMDAISRQSLTVDQLAKGEGTVSTGIVTLGPSQVMLKVRGGVVESIMTGGIPESEGKNIKTNRGVAVYESTEKVKQVYGDPQSESDKELVYKGSTYQMQFAVFQNRVIGYRFDRVQ